MTKNGSVFTGKWTGLIFAVQFLTIFPIPSRHRFDAGKAMPFFPLCGLLIGLVLSGAYTIAAGLWPAPVAAVVTTILLAVISGALHLDGLADTADGLYGQRKPESALAIMKDSRVGAMGLVAVACCLALKMTAMAHMIGRPQIWLLLVPAYARASVLIGTRLLPYGRAEDGTAHAFFQRPLSPKDFWGFGLLLPLSLILGWQAVSLNLVFVLFLAVILSWYRRRMGFITGDMIGAMIEVTETGLFLAAALYWKG